MPTTTPASRVAITAMGSDTQNGVPKLTDMTAAV